MAEVSGAIAGAHGGESAALFCNWSNLRQRPHHLACVLAECGFAVDVFSSRTVRNFWSPHPLPSPGRLISRQMLPCKLEFVPGVRRFNQGRLWQAMDDFFAAERRWHFFALAPSPSIPRQLPQGLVYDCMDDWSDMPGVPYSRDGENRLCEAAVRVWATSRVLHARLAASFGDKVEYVPNGVAYEHFKDVPAARARLPRKRPVLGYVGAVYSWFDVALVGELARTLHDWEIELVGPVRLNAGQRDALRADNVVLRGAQPYARLPALMARYDVAMIPFVKSKLIEATNPIKLFEYLAAGLPVVTTPMPEVLPFSEAGVVACAEAPGEFAEKVRAMLGTEQLARRQEIAKKNSWRARFSDAVGRLSSR